MNLSFWRRVFTGKGNARGAAAPIGAVLTLACFAAVAEPAGAQESAPRKELDWPDTFAAKRAHAFFKAAEAEDDAPMREFQQLIRSPESLKETPLEHRVTKARSLREQAGAVEIGKVVPDGEYNVDVIGKSSKLGLWLKFRFVFDPAEPHYLVSMQGTPTTAPSEPPVALESADSVEKLLEQACKKSGIAAFAIAVIKEGRVQEVAAAGVRRNDRPDPVRPTDRFHIGSVGKSMAATLVAKLVEEGKLRWDSKVGEVLSGIPMRSEYADVTLEQLLQHRGGIAAYTEDLPMEHDQALKNSGTCTKQRTAFAAEFLNESPVVPPGAVMIYSNAGYSLAALMAENVTKKSWEELMTTMLFPALDLKTCGLGWPATPDRPDQPYGHFDNPPSLRVQNFGDYDLGDYLSPAGDIHCSAEDLAKYVVFHLAGIQGKDGWLSAETVRRLHRPPGTERPSYAAGWMVEEPPGAKVRHWHDGSAGTFYTRAVMYPDDGFALVVLSNAGIPAKPWADEIIRVACKMNSFTCE